MARPKTTAEDVTTVSLRLSYRSWENLRSIASTMGLSRSQLVEKIADQEIPIGNLQASKVQILGKSANKKMMGI